MIYKIDLSVFRNAKQDAIYNWFRSSYGDHGTHARWNYHHQPSRDKYWVETRDLSLLMMYNLVWA